MELRLKKDVKEIFDKAVNLAVSRKDEYITPEHILFAVADNEDFADVFEILGGDIDILQSCLIEELDELEKTSVPGKIKESKSFGELCMASTLAGIATGNVALSIVELLVGFSKVDCVAKDLVDDQSVSISDIINGLRKKASSETFSHSSSSEESSGKVTSGTSTKTKTKGWRKNVTYLNDLVAKSTMPFIGRESEIERTSQILCRATKNNPILVGEPGVGKTAIVEGLTKMIVDGEISEKLKDAEVYSLDLGDLISGTQFRGEFEDKFKSILEGLSNEVDNPILYIDEIHNIVGLGASSGSGFDGANLIKRYATEGKIKFIGTTTYDEYKKIFQKDKALDRRFKKVDVVEPSVNDCIEILKGLKGYYEDFHKVTYSLEAIEQAVVLSDKYINNKFLPDKAIDLIDEAGANYSMNRDASDTTKIEITKEMIEEVLSKTCNIPKKTLESSDVDTLMNLESNIIKNVFGQDEAAKQLVNSIKLSRAGLSDGNKPIASLLFVGPTGVGKTEIAKTVAKLMFGGEDKLIRFDMSEYMEKHSVSKLIGSPAGYVGYDEGGLLVDKIIQNPSCVLLLDEIEKAHPDVFNTLLQVMDYATLTDNKGRKADFRNVLIIMTSNAGATASTAPTLGFTSSPKKVDNSKIEDAVKNLFTPEFRNRLTKTIVFNPMDDKMAEKIVDKQLGIFAEILKVKNVKVSYTDALKKYIKERGVSKDFGAREIQRVIENEIKPLFVDELLAGKLVSGGNCSLEYSEDMGISLNIK